MSNFPSNPFSNTMKESLAEDNLKGKEAALREILKKHAPLLIAYSGGVDSTLLLAVAHETLGTHCMGMIADSPSLPRSSLDEALRVATALGVSIEVVATTELNDPRYAENPLNRCYFCKAELFSKMEEIASSKKFAAIAYGENADDPPHLRPGSQAAVEFSVLAPLKEAGLTKADVRALSHKLGLPTANAPAQPCLSSRIPHGTRVTREALDFVERGEAIVRQFGFNIFRVRYILPPEKSAITRPGANVQIAPDEMYRLEPIRMALIGALSASGFGRIDIDQQGYQISAH